MAEMLAEQYCSVFSEPKEAMPTCDEIFSNEATNSPQLLDIEFTETDIMKAISEVSNTAAAGPDRYPALLLKNCKAEVSKPLYMIWRKSLDTGTIPQLMKTANIISIHKGGSRSVPANYRPVALTSHIINIFEKVV